jgi:hypothetical protein
MATDIITNAFVQVDPDPQTRRRKIHCKQELIISSLQKFYGGRADTDTGEILELLQGTSRISLRLIDWFVTNYSKQYNISYILNNQEFLVYTNYKSQLKAYSKKLFDPFCRRERIMFQLAGQQPFLTTVGKLNFFRWAIEKGIIDYIKLNLVKIEKEMNTNAREQQKLRKQLDTPSTGQSSTASTATTGTAVTAGTTRRRARVHIGQSGGKSIEKHDLQVEVRFD